jgi:hypothetical protein
MSVYIGGLRERIIRDNLRNMIEESLNELGWFDDGRNHKPVDIKSAPYDNDVEIVPNAVGIAFEESFNEELEMGSNLTETSHDAYIDIYAESDAVGMQLSGDIYDIVRGKFSSLALSGISAQPNGRMKIKDPTQAGNPVIFYVGLEEIHMHRNRKWRDQFNKFWWTIAVTIIDTYMDDNDDSVEYN